MATTILIADDERSLRRLVSVGLAVGDYRILEARDGEEAWRVLQAERPAVALLDVQMPVRTGLELTEAIRRDDDLAGTRVVLLSAKAQPADVAAGLAAGADRYLTKPFSLAELLAVVRNELAMTAPGMGAVPLGGEA